MNNTGYYKKLLMLFFLFLLCLPLISFSQTKDKNYILKKVVIDPGHGGKHPGAIYGSVKESDINLKTALFLGQMIEKNYPSVEVIYTRKTDKFVGLMERADIANKAGADLFISIHVNAAKNRAASGTETLIMGVNKSNQNLEIAMRENEVITYEDDYSVKYSGFDPNSAESYIMFSLMQYNYHAQSAAFADLIQKEYTKNVKRVNRGVKESPVLVLWYTTMPSILTEIGFLSNSEEAALIKTESYQRNIATSIFNAFAKYKNDMDGSTLITETVVIDDSGEKQAPEV